MNESGRSSQRQKHVAYSVQLWLDRREIWALSRFLSTFIIHFKLELVSEAWPWAEKHGGWEG
jgi:hypothetical protein